MNYFRKRIRLIAFGLFCLFFTSIAAQNVVHAGTAQFYLKKNVISSSEIKTDDLCGVLGLGTLSGAIAAGAGLVSVAYIIGTGIGQFARNIGGQVEMSQLNIDHYVSNDFSKFDI